MSEKSIAALFRAWQASRWEMEVHARLLDKELADAEGGGCTWPYERLEDYEVLRSRAAAHYSALRSAIRQRRLSPMRDLPPATCQKSQVD